MEQSKDGHHFLERTQFLRAYKIFVKKGVVQKKKLTMDEQSSLFRKIKKILFLKNER